MKTILISGFIFVCFISCELPENNNIESAESEITITDSITADSTRINYIETHEDAVIRIMNEKLKKMIDSWDEKDRKEYLEKHGIEKE